MAEQSSSDPTKWGDAPLIQSTEITDKQWVDIRSISPALVNQSFWVRGHLQNVRAKSKLAFLLLRQGSSTIQAVLSQGDDVPKPMIKYVSSINKESVVDVFVTVMAPQEPIKSTTQKDVELSVLKVFTISRAMLNLPFQIEDASRPDVQLEDESSQYVDVGLDTRLNNRVMDLRTPANQAIMRIQSGVCQHFRQFLINRGFVGTSRCSRDVMDGDIKT